MEIMWNYVNRNYFSPKIKGALNSFVGFHHTYFTSVQK